MKFNIVPEPKIHYWPNRQKQLEKWCVGDIIHRVDGPAYRVWYETGNLLYDYWYFNNQSHRVDGPACRAWNGKGQLVYNEWYFFGNELNYKKSEEYIDWLHNYNLFEKTIWTDEEKVLWKLTWM